MDLRDERFEEWTAVRALHQSAFGDHGQVVTRLVDDLREAVTADSGLSLVAEDAGEIVGHVMFTRALLDTPRRLVEVQVLSPVSVLPARQATGIGSALIRAGLQVMAERSVPVVFLEGDPGFYSRLGFAAAGEQGFRKPSLRIPDAAFQALRLPAHQEWMIGTFVYADVFWRHDAVGLRDQDN
ncbi:MAG: GNAT family N-acetyltransferase [Propionibacteriales bacterium]|nr:GNAT family N-acetyltransferase [Propionibacteriales bacterium]